MELSPPVASRMALDVYAVNGGDEYELKAFLNGNKFAQGNGGQKSLSADVGGRIFRSAKDGFGLCAKGTGIYQNDLFLIFRGTTTANNKADIISDARVGLERSTGGHSVHIGFNHCFKSMLPDIQAFIAKARITGTVHCVGHSLGGAVAALAADWACRNMSLPVKLYTFGQPRTGLSMFSLMLTQKLGSKNIFRTFHTTDPVPMVPVFPYVHSPLPGNGRRVISGNPIHTGDAHRMTLYSTSMNNKSWGDFSLAPPINTQTDAIKGWLKSNANSNPMCPKTFEWLENALIWLLSKQLSAIAGGIQWGAMGVHSFADKVAWVLAKGIAVGEECAVYVKLFMRKVMKILGMKVRETAENLTQSFFRYLLQALTQRANELAMKALRGLSNRG